MSFEISFQQVVMIEGGYSDHPSDTGGKTMYGITEQVARDNGYTGAMKDLPLETAKAIYKAQYWDINRLDDVDAISKEIAHEMFDTGVNMGVGYAVKFLQRSLNVLNRIGRDYRDISTDGVMGPSTLSALRAYINKRGHTILLKALNVLQGARYIDLAERREKNEDFVNGWLDHRIEL